MPPSPTLQALSPNHRQILWVVAALLTCLAGFFALPSLAMVAVMAVMAIALPELGAADAIWGPGMVAAPFVGLLGLTLGSAVGAQRPWGRVPQTLLALTAMPLFPIGTVYTAYALWACWWWNDDRRERGWPPIGWIGAWVVWWVVAIPVPMIALITLLRLATAPLDLTLVEGETTPVEDRQQRRSSVAACGLTGVQGADGCVPAAPTEARLEEVVVPTPGPPGEPQSAKGTLHVPEGLALPRPAVLLLQDTTDQDRKGNNRGETLEPHHALFLHVTEDLAEHLVTQGLVVLRVDKRSCAKCQGKQSVPGYRLEQSVADTQAALDWLIARPEVAGGVVLVGHGEGGLVALALADRPGVAAVATLATPLVTLERRILGPIERHRALREQIGDTLGVGSDTQDLGRFGRCLADFPNGLGGCRWNKVELTALEGYDALVQTATSRPSPVPLFVAYGTLDLDAPPSSLTAMRDVQRGADAEFHVIPGMCHRLEDFRERPRKPGPLHPAVLERLDQFLESVVPLGAPATDDPGTDPG